MTTSICIVDDERLIIEVLIAYFEKEGYVVYSATNGREGLKIIQDKKPDLIILDLMLPDITGEEICMQIRKSSDVPIIMLTAKSQEEERIKGIIIGADDYITKPFSPKEVVVRAQAILRRTQRIEERGQLVFNDRQLILNLPQHQVLLGNEEISLTPIEFKLLSGMARYPGRVYSRFDLLEMVQTDAFEGYERSIDVHIKNLRKKIEHDPKKPQYIVTVYGIGYKFGGKPYVAHTSQ